MKEASTIKELISEEDNLSCEEVLSDDLDGGLSEEEAQESFHCSA
jgi:hypothetical protein